jgi:flagellar hook assembly protein FlgD
LSAYPNPFTRGLRVTVSGAAQNSRITVSVYNISGKLVRSLRPVASGMNTFIAAWDGQTSAGEKAGTGIYLLKATVNNRILEEKILGMK